MQASIRHSLSTDWGRSWAVTVFRSPLFVQAYCTRLQRWQITTVSIFSWWFLAVVSPPARTHALYKTTACGRGKPWPFIYFLFPMRCFPWGLPVVDTIARWVVPMWILAIFFPPTVASLAVPCTWLGKLKSVYRLMSLLVRMSAIIAFWSHISLLRVLPVWNMLRVVIHHCQIVYVVLV